MGAKLGDEVDRAAYRTLETIWAHFIDGGFRHDTAWNCYGPYLTLQLRNNAVFPAISDKCVKNTFHKIGVKLEKQNLIQIEGKIPMKILHIFLLLVLFFIAPLNAEEYSPEPGKRRVVHTVQRGEELHLLAGYYRLNARDWHKLYTWNSDLVKNQNRIYPGQDLVIYVANDWTPPYNLDEYVRSIGRR